MTYQEIRTALKNFQEQGYEIPALNSKKEVLETALEAIQLLVNAENEVLEVAEVTIAPTEEIQSAIAPDPIAPPADTHPLAPRPVVGWQLLKLELTDDLRFVGTVVLYAFSILKFLAIKATPYIKKALNFALRGAVYGAVAFKIFILPKIMIWAYLVGIWGVTIALRVVRGRQWAIA